VTTRVIDLEAVADSERERLVYKNLRFFDQTAQTKAPGLAASPGLLIIKGIGRGGQGITPKTCDVIVRESIVPEAAYFPAVYIGCDPQMAPNQSSPSVAMPEEASTEVDRASQRLFSAIVKLDALARLPAGWDGLDAPAADTRAVERAINLIARLAARARLENVVLPEPMVGPAGLGSVQLEWQDGHRFVAVQVPATAEPLSFYAEIDDREALSDEAQPGGIWEVVRAMAESEA